MSELGKKLKQVRKENGLTQDALSNALNKKYGLNIDAVMISKWETGYQTPIISTLKCIADYFSVSLDFLNGIEKEPSNISAVYTENIFNIPLFESVSAGFGAYADDYIVDYVPIYIKNASKAPDTLCIKVTGESMFPKIEDGDIIVVHKQDSVDSGDIAVVLIDDEAGLVKKIVYDHDNIELHSVNPMYPVRKFSGADVLRVSVVGKVQKIIKEL